MQTTGTIAVIFSRHDPRYVSSRGRENTLREYVAIDEAFRPFVITFWNDAVPDDTYSMLDCVKNQHVIAGLNFNVTRYHGWWWWKIFTLEVEDYVRSRRS